MAELITFPDVEAAMVSFLRGKLVSGAFAGTKAHTRVPTPRPAEFVRVEVVGGFERNIVTDVSRFVIEAWAESTVRAAELSALVRSWLLSAGRDGALGGETINEVSVVSRPQRLPDPDTDQVRYTATYEVAFRASA